MKRFILLFFLFTGIFSFSQTLDLVARKNLFHSIENMKMKSNYMKIVDSCNVYLSFPLVDSCETADVISKKAIAYLELYNNYYYKEGYLNVNDMSIQELPEKINLLFDSAVKLCDYNKIKYFYRNYLLYNVYSPDHKGYNYKHIKTLNKYGFKHDRDFFSIGITPQYIYGNNQWVGAEISFFAFSDYYFLRDTRFNESRLITWQGLASLTLLDVGYRHNISAKGWGMNLSLISLTSYWVNVRPINFTYLNNGQNGTFGYSPELGFQIWYLHLNAGYHAAFKKSMRDYEKFYFTAKFKIPLIKLL